MTATAEQLRSNLLALPETDRAALAQLLLESLEPMISDDEVDFDDELVRRRAEILAGTVTPIPAEEAMRQVREALASQPGR